MAVWDNNVQNAGNTAGIISDVVRPAVGLYPGELFFKFDGTQISRWDGVGWTDFSTGGGGGVPTSRTLTINGDTEDLTINRTFPMGILDQNLTYQGADFRISGSGELAAIFINDLQTNRPFHPIDSGAVNITRYQTSLLDNSGLSFLKDFWQWVAVSRPQDPAVPYDMVWHDMSYNRNAGGWIDNTTAYFDSRLETSYSTGPTYGVSFERHFMNVAVPGGSGDGVRLYSVYASQVYEGRASHELRGREYHYFYEDNVTELFSILTTGIYSNALTALSGDLTLNSIGVGSKVTTSSTFTCIDINIGGDARVSGFAKLYFNATNTNTSIWSEQASSDTLRIYNQTGALWTSQNNNLAFIGQSNSDNSPKVIFASSYGTNNNGFDVDYAFQVGGKAWFNNYTYVNNFFGVNGFVGINTGASGANVAYYLGIGSDNGQNVMSLYAYSAFTFYNTTSSGAPGGTQNFQINGLGIKTADPGSGNAFWKLGTKQAGVVALDAANYLEVNIDGVGIVKILIAS